MSDDITLKKYIDSELDNIKELLKVNIDSIKEATVRYQQTTDQRFLDSEKAVGTAFDAAKEAVIKSELGVEKRSDAVYVTLSKLQDALALVMPRAEAEQRFFAQNEKIDELKSSRDSSEGRSTGLNAGWVLLVGAIGLVGTVAGLILAFR